MAFKPIDPKRDEFRRYLERSGVIEALTKVFVRLVTERPENPMEFLQAKLGDSKLHSDHEAYMRKELEEAKAEIQRLRQRILAIDPTALDDDKSTPSNATTEIIDNSTGTRDAKGRSGSQNDLPEKGSSSTQNDRKITDATNFELNSNHPRSEDQQRRDAHVEENIEVPDDHCESDVKENNINLPSDKSNEKGNE